MVALARYLDDVWIFSVDTMRWMQAELTSTVGPGPRAGHIAVSVGQSSILVFGGVGPEQENNNVSHGFIPEVLGGFSVSRLNVENLKFSLVLLTSVTSRSKIFSLEAGMIQLLVHLVVIAQHCLDYACAFGFYFYNFLSA